MRSASAAAPVSVVGPLCTPLDVLGDGAPEPGGDRYVAVHGVGTTAIRKLANAVDQFGRPKGARVGVPFECHDPGVGEVAGAEQHAPLAALELRQAVLQAAVQADGGAYLSIPDRLIAALACSEQVGS